MNKAHSPINWENYPNETTPINEGNLNKMDRAIGIIDDRVIEQESKKLSKADASSDIVNVEYDKDTSVFQFTKRNGETVKVDVSSVVVREGYTKEESDQRYANAIKVTHSGETIAATDSAEAKFEGLRVFGRSEQASTTGKNKFDIEGWLKGLGFVYSKTGNVITVEINGNPNIYGLTTFENAYKFSETDVQVTVSFKSLQGLVSDNKPSIQIFNSSGTKVGSVSSGENKSVTATGCRVGILYNTMSLTGSGVTFDSVQIELGSSATEYEPYTGGKPSPSPEYPQQIESVGDDGNVDVGVYGKNLFGGEEFANKFMEVVENAIIDTEKGTVYAMAGYVKGKVFFDTFKENTQYTLIFKASVRTQGGLSIQIKYTDGTAKIPKIEEVGVVSTVRVVSEAGKTISMLEGIWQADTTYYYNECGLFEGDVSLEDFEPYKGQTLSISTPNGLPGIKVKKAEYATYKDKNGVMLVSDEIDFAKCKYVHRVKKVTPTLVGGGYHTNGNYYVVVNVDNKVYEIVGSMCSKAINGRDTDFMYSDGYYYENASNFVFNGTPDDNLETMKEKLNGMELLYVLAEPIETDLSAEEIEAYKALHSNYPTTTILNDENAHMETTLVVDTKNHIEQNYVPKSEFLSVVGRVSALEQLALA